MSRETAFSNTKPGQHLWEGRSHRGIKWMRVHEGGGGQGWTLWCTQAHPILSPLPRGKQTGCTPTIVPALPPAGDTLWPAQMFVSFLVL